MTSEMQSVYQAALALLESERLKLVERLMETMPVPGDDLTEEEFVAELDRRFAEIQKDPSAGIPWSEIQREP